MERQNYGAIPKRFSKLLSCFQNRLSSFEFPGTTLPSLGVCGCVGGSGATTDMSSLITSVFSR